ncbi:MAG: hypothetical protein DRJ35_02195 [Thermoprotei archaeon]|nr:MAG: hypothetical protein DRJ35_02195 [Thermoprotei archaeon]
MERFIEVRTPISPTEYTILKHVPRVRKYAELSKATGISISYVSLKLKNLLKHNIRIRACFDLKAMKLSPILILANYTEHIYNPPHGIKIPYILKLVKFYSGKKNKLFIYAVSPKGSEDELVEALNISVDTYHIIDTVYRWKIDTAKLTEYRDNILISNYEKLPQILPEIEPYQPTSTLKRIPDMIDLWLIAELMRDPFVKISTRIKEAGIRQQVASYHLSRHVLKYHLYNIVEFKPQASSKSLLLKIHVRKEENKRFAKALTESPAVQEAYTLATRKDTIYAILTAYPSEEVQLFKKLVELDIIEDFEIVGLILEPPKEYTIPFKNVVGYGNWILDPLYAAIRAINKNLRRVKYSYKVYELS